MAIHKLGEREVEKSIYSVGVCIPTCSLPLNSYHGGGFFFLARVSEWVVIYATSSISFGRVSNEDISLTGGYYHTGSLHLTR